MSQPKVSLIASSVRYELYEDLFKSLEGTSVDYEVVFAGNRPPEKQYEGLKYIIHQQFIPNNNWN